MSELTRDDVIEVLLKVAESQVKALRAMRKGQQASRRLGRGGKKSNIAVVEDILRTAGGPLHVEQILEIAQSRFRRTLSRESLVSAITKKVLDETTFCRVGRNTFDLIDRTKG